MLTLIMTIALLAFVVPCVLGFCDDDPKTFGVSLAKWVRFSGKHVGLVLLALAVVFIAAFWKGQWALVVFAVVLLIALVPSWWQQPQGVRMRDWFVRMGDKIHGQGTPKKPKPGSRRVQ